MKVSKILFLGLIIALFAALLAVTDLFIKETEATKEAQQTRDSLTLAQNEIAILTAQRDSAIQSAQQLNGINDTQCREALIVLRELLPAIENFHYEVSDAFAKIPGKGVITEKHTLKEKQY